MLIGCSNVFSIVCGHFVVAVRCGRCEEGGVVGKMQWVYFCGTVVAV